jgi:hypothetical protein
MAPPLGPFNIKRRSRILFSDRIPRSISVDIRAQVSHSAQLFIGSVLLFAMHRCSVVVYRGMRIAQCCEDSQLIIFHAGKLFKMPTITSHRDPLHRHLFSLRPRSRSPHRVISFLWDPNLGPLLNQTWPRTKMVSSSRCHRSHRPPHASEASYHGSLISIEQIRGP